MGRKWERSGLVERDNNDVKADGCLAYFFTSGTTPLTVYSDAAETTPHAHPLEADANGRWPLVFIPFTATYDEKVVTSGGTQLSYYLSIPNPDPVEEAEDDVDDNQLLQTGDWLFTTKTGTRSGFVRANGRTIGSASSGATERANADTEDLYAFLWDNHADGICAVTGGRGASAAADFAANKPIALFDCRSASPMGVDDMGNSALSAGYGGSFTTGNATTGGSVGGANTHALVTGELAAHTHSVSGTTDGGGEHTHTVNDPGHVHSQIGTSFISVAAGGSTAAENNTANTGLATTGINLSVASNHTHTFSATSGSTGSGTAHNNMSRHVLGNWHIKL